jgi:hypothetical protein
VGKKIVAAGIACMIVLVTIHAFAQEFETYLFIDLWKNRIRLIENGLIVYDFKIAPGAVDTPTPIGTYTVIQKAKDWGSGFGTRWIGLNVPWGIYGIHGTNRPHLIGQYVSHGCIRMRNRDIELLYPEIRRGMKVFIDGPIFGHPRLNYRILVKGSRGALVYLVQNRLKAGGFYHGKVNGIFDQATESAVIQFQKQSGLPVTKQIQLADLLELGIVE